MWIISSLVSLLAVVIEEGINQAQLVKEAVKGSVKAFEILINEHKLKLFNFAVGITEGDRSLASDILQKSLIKAFLNIRSFKGKSSFSSWLYRIARNEFLNYMKSTEVRERSSMESVLERAPLESGQDIEKEIIREEREKAVHTIISKLPEIYREAIILVDLQEMKYGEAASLIGIKEDALRSRLFKARQMLSEVVMKNKKLFL